MNKKNILLCVTGLSPQVVTETLFGIAQSDLEWPNEIQIITTKKGKEQARLGLIAPQNDAVSILKQFCIEYEKPLPILTDDLILVVPDASGQEVDDARTFADQEALADFIVKHVANLCSNEAIQLHASLAGGRKTMTFFLGYAMTLFSRVGDRLSHVLIDEAFEGNPDFYYPTKNSRVISGRDKNIKLDTSKAKVMLAELPFIRQRNQLNKANSHFLQSLKQETYRDLVMYQNVVNEIGSIAIRINLVQKRLTIYGDNIPSKDIYFNKEPMDLAFYSMIARQVMNNGYSQLKKPDKTLKTDAEKRVNEKQNALGLTMMFLLEMEAIAGIKHDNSASNSDEPPSVKAFMSQFEKRMIALTEKNLVKPASVDEDIAQTYMELEFGMSQPFFSDRLTKLKAKLEKHFPADFVHTILPGQVYQKNNATLLRDYSTKNQQGTPYGLWLKPHNISIR